MHSTTLRGIFPEPKPVYRRNFIKENVRSIKQMQGILQEAGAIQPRKRRSTERYRNVPPIKSNISNTSKSLENIKDSTKNKINTQTRAFNAASIRTQMQKVAKAGPTKKNESGSHLSVNDAAEGSKFTHRAMQTERQEDLSRLYEVGVIKYPSPGVLKASKNLNSSSGIHTGGEGDQANNISHIVENLSLDDNRDFVKENKIIRTKVPKQSPTKVPAQPPPTYQRGVVPKYLKDRKDDPPADFDAECPPGHVLLPEEERKETLRVLRQSYADRIQELNMMPVRNDTLKMKKRKIEIEEELKRIDGGIKVFQRPKVYVKINA